MARYSDYKDSGVQWLGEIPSHWEVVRAKYLFKKELRAIRNNDDIITCFRDGEVTLRKNRRTTGFTEATDYSHYQHICKGDLVIHQMDAFAGSCGVSDSDGMGSPILSVCTALTNKTDNYYFAHAIRLMGWNGFIYSLYRGIRERSSDFRFDTFQKLFLPLPPREEQEGIVAYLDEKCEKLDKLVAAKERKIALLGEMKQRLISDAVTRGLNASAPLKATTIPWLPQVPAHWEMLRNKTFLTLTDEKVGNRKDITLLSLTKQGVIIRDLSEGKGKFPKDFDTYLIVHPNNLVFCLFDIDETPRTVGLVHNYGMLTGAYTNFEVNEDIVLPEFAYYYYLQVDDKKGLRPFYTGLRKVVKSTTFLQLRMPVPPVEEQREIVAYIEERAEKIDALVAKLRAEIEHIKEYKQRLISDVVTGQIKVC